MSDYKKYPFSPKVLRVGPEVGDTEFDEGNQLWRKKPRTHDKELQDHERAHTGEPGAKVRHGADATGKVIGKQLLGND